MWCGTVHRLAVSSTFGGHLVKQLISYIPAQQRTFQRDLALDINCHWCTLSSQCKKALSLPYMPHKRFVYAGKKCTGLHRY